MQCLALLQGPRFGVKIRLGGTHTHGTHSASTVWVLFELQGSCSPLQPAYIDWHNTTNQGGGILINASRLERAQAVRSWGGSDHRPPLGLSYWKRATSVLCNSMHPRRRKVLRNVQWWNGTCRWKIDRMLCVRMVYGCPRSAWTGCHRPWEGAGEGESFEDKQSRRRPLPILLTTIGRTVRILKSSWRCSASRLSNRLQNRDPLLMAQNRHRSMKAVKFSSSVLLATCRCCSLSLLNISIRSDIFRFGWRCWDD